MKTMTCKQLGGACDEEFEAENFEQMAELSKNHGTEMALKADPDHMSAMGEMSELMKDPDAMKQWFDGKRKEFEEMPDDQ